MSARDDLAEVLHVWSEGHEWRSAECDESCGSWLDAADTVIREWLPTLADDDVLVRRLAAPKRPPVRDPWLTQRITEGVRHDLRALAAALTPPP